MMTSMHINFQKHRYERQAKNNITYPDNIFGLIIVGFDRIYSESNRYKAKKQSIFMWIYITFSQQGFTTPHLIYVPEHC